MQFTMLNSKYSEDNTDIRRRLNLVLFSFVFFFFSYNSIQSLKGLKNSLVLIPWKWFILRIQVGATYIAGNVLSIVTSYAVLLN